MRAFKTVLLGGAALLASPAYAQTSQGATQAESQATDGTTVQSTAAGLDPDGVEEIVVTAERRQTNLQDTPISITAVTAETLEAQGVRTVNDLAATVPNLTSTTGPQGSSDANFFVRGVGQFDVIVTNDPGVGVYVDGVYLGRTVGALLDSGDIGRVEVLRGPQGTLFGRNTLGGAISVTSKAPDLGRFSSTLRATYGSRDRMELDGSINAPVGENLAVRAYGFTRDQDGFARRTFDGVLFGKTERRGGKLQLLAEPTEALTISLIGDYVLDRSNPAPSVLRAIAPFPFFPADAGSDRSNDFYTVFASNQPEARNEIYGVSGTISFDFGPVTLRSITAYRKLDGFSTSDPDGTGYRLYDQNLNTNQDQFSQELQLSGDVGPLNYLVGAYFFREQADQILDLCFAPITPTPTARFSACNVWSQGNDQVTRSYALFGQARYNLSEQLSVTLGGRYTIDRKRIVSNQFFDFRPAGFLVIPPTGAPSVVPGFVAPIVTNLGDRAIFKKFTPKIGVEYQPSNDLLLFASYAQGFRSGGFNGRLIAPQASVPTFEPDTNDSYEAGFKSDLLGRALRVNGSIFYSRYTDIQQTISDPQVQFRVANAGDAELYGAEVEITAVPIAGLRLNAGLGYSHSEFKNVPAAVGPINGNSLAFSPRYTAALGAEYGFDLAGLGRITPRADYRYQSRTYFSPFNLPLEQQGAYGLLSARVTFSDPSDRFSIAVYGDNLTQEEYYTFGQNALGAQGVAYTYLGRPREFGITAGVNF
jgi:iron complex outermembrane receptor protein